MTGHAWRATAVVFGIAASALFAGRAQADNSLVTFPATYAEGVHYGTVTRGGITEELFTDRAAIEAAKRGEPFPDGTVITLVDHRQGGIHRYVVMEKRAGWHALSPDGVGTGDWLFRAFGPDGSPNLSDDGSRCMACHQSQGGQDFVFTVEQMRNTN